MHAECGDASPEALVIAEPDLTNGLTGNPSLVGARIKSGHDISQSANPPSAPAGEAVRGKSPQVMSFGQCEKELVRRRAVTGGE
jgi:hypothetical protein